MNDIKLPLISIIVAIYNVKDYLDECIGSIIEQTYENVEILLINDGSTDGSDAICEFWLKKDTRIKLITKSNGGLSDARNVGIAAATGAFLMFVDGDDYISCDIVQHLFDTLKKYSADIAICDPAHCTQDERAKFCGATYLRAFDAEEAICEMLYQTSFLFSACGKLFNRKAYHNVRFPLGVLFEDVAVMHRLFSNAQKIVYSNAKLYGYVHREGSITTKNFDRRDLYILDICRDIEEFALQRSRQIKKAVDAYYVTAAFRVYLNSPKDFINERKNCREIIRKRWLRVLIDSKCRNKTKAAVLLFVFCKPALGRVYKRVNRWE